MGSRRGAPLSRSADRTAVRVRRVGCCVGARWPGGAGDRLRREVAELGRDEPAGDVLVEERVDRRVEASDGLVVASTGDVNCDVHEVNTKSVLHATAQEGHERKHPVAAHEGAGHSSAGRADDLEPPLGLSRRVMVDFHGIVGSSTGEHVVRGVEPPHVLAALDTVGPTGLEVERLGRNEIVGLIVGLLAHGISSTDGERG